MKEFLLIVFSFFCGSLLFSYWIGKFFLQKDIREVGDGNPGASNVFRSGGRLSGILAMLLDFAKGFFPVLVLQKHFDYEHFSFILFCLAPVLGHAFSPFLQWKGGKAVAVTFGIWSGLTLWVVPVVFGSALTLLNYTAKGLTDGWKVMLGMTTIIIPLILLKSPPSFWIILFLNSMIVAYKHEEDLIKPLSSGPGRAA